MATIVVIGSSPVGEVEELIVSHGHEVVWQPTIYQEDPQVKGTPFAAAAAMSMAISQAMRLPAHLQQSAMAAISPYRSRGKGRGGPSRNFLKGAFNNRYPMPHQGKAEVARRRKAIAAGKLCVDLIQGR